MRTDIAQVQSFLNDRCELVTGYPASHRAKVHQQELYAAYVDWLKPGEYRLGTTNFYKILSSAEVDLVRTGKIFYGVCLK